MQVVFRIILLMFALTLSGQNSGQKPPQKQGQKQQKKKDNNNYDPAILAPGEIACGRDGHPRSAPCECMKHRIAAWDAGAEKCKLMFSEPKDINSCIGKLGGICEMNVRDRDHIGFTADGTEMPTQCSRSCTRAKCECCRS